MSLVCELLCMNINITINLSINLIIQTHICSPLALPSSLYRRIRLCIIMYFCLLLYVCLINNELLQSVKKTSYPAYNARVIFEAVNFSWLVKKLTF